jgi:DNA-binding transcriptional ArsR family regulator
MVISLHNDLSPTTNGNIIELHTMNLSGIKSIYADVGKDRCDSLFFNKPKCQVTRHIRESSIQIIANLIKCHKKITRKYLLVKSGMSRTTVEYAIKVLSDRRVITKVRDTEMIGHPISYLMAKS